MTTEKEENMRAALRQASAIMAVGGPRSTRRMLVLAHALYDGLAVLDSKSRARRIWLIDAIFGSSVRDLEHRAGRP